MHSTNVVFCRLLLKSIRPHVNKLVPVEIRKEAWVYDLGRDLWEFQIPSQKFYWHGNASCAYEARYEGWVAYLTQYHDAEFKALEEAEIDALYDAAEDI